MAEAESRQSEDPGLEVDADIDDWEPIDIQPEPCPQCGTLVEGGYWVVENPSDDHYTGYCNEMHFQIHHKLGLWREEKLEALPL